MQAYGTAIYLLSIVGPQGTPAVTMSSMTFIPLTVLTFTCGTIFIMWLGEQITERGIGNGISLIIFIGIIARFPHSWSRKYRCCGRAPVRFSSKSRWSH